MPDGHEGIADSFAEPCERAANVEYFCVMFALPQEGHSVVSSARRTSFSKLFPHPSHTYSKIGIIYSANSNAILSIHLRTSPDGAEKLFTMIENASHPRVLLST